MKREYPNTMKALEEFESTRSERESAWLKVESEEEINKCVDADTEAANKIREAFYLDTQDINTHENCMLIHADDIRRLAHGIAKS